MDKIEELRKRMIASAKKKVQEKYSEKDVHIIRAANILEDLDSVSNLLTEQLIEWYSVHFPELQGMESEEKYLELVYKLGEREKFSAKSVKEITDDSESAAAIAEKAKTSMGSPAEKSEIAEMQVLAMNCMNLKQEREYISNYIEGAMKKEMPNFTEIAGHVIGAKILAKTGSKKKLAFLPASAIQVIGAEKALFNHFRTGAKGPKHGFIYQHPLVKAAKKENKGRIARSLASKMAIAARKDYFGNTSGAGEMKRDLDARAKELEERKNPEKKGKASPQKFENERRKNYVRERNEMDRGRGERRGFGRRPFKRDDSPRENRGARKYPSSTRGGFREKRDWKKPSAGTRGFRENRESGEGANFEKPRQRPFGRGNAKPFAKKDSKRGFGGPKGKPSRGFGKKPAHGKKGKRN